MVVVVVGLSLCKNNVLRRLGICLQTLNNTCTHKNDYACTQCIAKRKILVDQVYYKYKWLELISHPKFDIASWYLHVIYV